MKNSTLKFLFTIISLSLTLMACSEDILESAPYSFTSPENFYETADDAELAINGCYSVINDRDIHGDGNYDTFGRGLLFMLNAGTDEMVTRDGFGNIDYAPWGLASFTSTNKFLGFNWLYWYSGINRVNTLLENIDGIDMPENRQNEIEGEARFLRGLYHMYLAKMFGGVPTYTTSQADPLKARQPLNEVYELIISDFTYAYQNLNDQSSVIGRANKWTAGGYLAKVYAYLGSCKTFNVGEDLNFTLNSFNWVDANQMYANALSISTDVVNNSGYILIDEYDNLFRATTDSYQRQESLFMAEASNDISRNNVNIWVNLLLPQGNPSIVGGGNGWMRATGEMYNKYTDGDFRRTHNLTGSLANNASFEEIDGIRYFIPRPLSDPNQGNYCQGKFRYQDPSQKALPFWASGGDLPLLRFADILLIKAESEYFTGNETGARNTMSIVRTRALEAGTTLEDLNTAYFKTDFVEELLEERSRELAFECQRRFDLMRFNKFTEAINNLDPDAGRWNTVVPQLQSNWSPNRIWFPIPLNQTSINPNLLPNNPGF
jgi:hypothetical protein